MRSINKKMREYIYQLVKSEGRSGKIYSVFMMIIIFLSLLPLTMKGDNYYMNIIDSMTVTLFVIDYLMRWVTADYYYGKRSVIAFVRYPFSLMALIDLLSILPSISVINDAFRVLRISRFLRAMKVIRVLKSFRYSKNLQTILNVLRKQSGMLIAVTILACAYIFVAALIVFNIEPETFDHFFDAIYWATVSLTTMGYGDIYPISMCGRFFTMISAFLGIAIIALPAGIITAGYMHEMNKDVQS